MNMNTKHWFLFILLFYFQPDPLVCKCQNGGLCLEAEAGGALLSQCACPDNFVGQYCDIRRDGTGLQRASSPAAVVVPVILIIAVIVCAMALYVYYQRKRGE